MGPIVLIPFIQTYQWGSIGSSSLIHRLGLSNDSGPLAEAWSGAHEKYSSTITLGGGTTTLASFIASDPEGILGKRVAKKFANSLPWLFKVLSVGKRLSLQMHPDEEQAAALHRRFPMQYPESAPKPEILVALSQVTLLAGFRDLTAIRKLAFTAPEVEMLLSSPFPQPLSELARRWLRTPRARVRECIKVFRRRLEGNPNPSTEELWTMNLLELDDEEPEPGDPAVFSPYFLNLVHVPPERALFIPPKTLHAYLAGDLAECMNTSDFVIRAGLTPKPTDLETLLATMSHEAWTPRVQSGQLNGDRAFAAFSAPVDQFQLELASSSQFRVSASTEEGLHFLFAVNGCGTLRIDTETIAVNPGSALIVPAGSGKYDLQYSGTIFRVLVP